MQRVINHLRGLPAVDSVWRMILVASLALLVSGSTASADDWPQWMGPERDSVWRETGIVEKFPENGPVGVWRTPVGYGYSGPAVADGRVFLMDYKKTEGEIANDPGRADKLGGLERVLCLDAKTGALLWETAYEQDYAISFGGGPRCTPTVDGDRVYTLGAEGKLKCLDVKTGDVLWDSDFKKAFGAKTPYWGHSAHPLVHGDMLYCVVGGPGSVAVAFDKITGDVKWKALEGEEQGYCPPTLIQHAGREQLLIWYPQSINSLDPGSGDVLWSLPLQPSYNMTIMAPRKLGDLLFASGIGHVGAVMKLNSAEPGAEFVWKGTPRNALYAANTTPFLEDGMIYGVDCDSSELIGAKLEDGKRLWETTEPVVGEVTRRTRHGTAFLVKNGDRFFIFNELGELIIAKLSPDGFDEIDRAQLLEPTSEVWGRKLVWTHPAFANKCVYARNDNEIVCVNLAAD